MVYKADGYGDEEIYNAATELVDSGDWELFTLDGLTPPDNVGIRRVV